MRRILVTGAGGFVGGHLLPRLRAAFPEAELATPGLDGGAFDVRDLDALTALMHDTPPDACIHLAAVTVVPTARLDPDRAWQVNLHGTLAMARTILREAPECVLLYPSSADCYGMSFRTGNPLDETAPLAPINTYGATKAAADLALGAMVGDGLRVIAHARSTTPAPGRHPTWWCPPLPVKWPVSRPACNRR